jgi:Sulfotransferase family
MRKIDTQVFVHVGYPRTATTLLQNVIFPNIPGLIFYYKYKPLKMYTRTGNPKYKDEVLKELQQYKENKNPVLFSDEGLIANSAIFQLNRLKEIFPHAHILITIRSQIDQIISRYQQTVKRGNEHKTLNGYLDFLTTWAQIGFTSYVDLIRFMQWLFENRVHVFIFEEFIKDINGFVSQLSQTLFNDQKEDIKNIDYAMKAQDAKMSYQNKSINSLFLLLRVMNYFPIFRKSVLGKKTVEGLTRLSTLIDNTGLWDKKIKKIKDRQFVIDATENAFFYQNKNLEKLINKKLPENYFV